MIYKTYLEPLAEVSHWIGWQSGSSRHEYHEQDLVLFTHLVKDLP